MQEYVDNKIGADMKYKGKTLIVNGTINNISKALGTPYITLKTDELIYSVQCSFSRGDEASLADLRKGQSIRIKGRCDGALGNVGLKNCSIEP